MTSPTETKTTIDSATRLAVDRTWLAGERTLMAWVRTAISLITFGFTIYKVFQLERGDLRKNGLVSANVFAVMMIVIGLMSLLMATLQHRRDLRALKPNTLARRGPWRGCLRP